MDMCVLPYNWIWNVATTSKTINFTILFTTIFCDSQAFEIIGREKPLQKGWYLQCVLTDGQILNARRDGLMATDCEKAAIGNVYCKSKQLAARVFAFSLVSEICHNVPDEIADPAGCDGESYQGEDVAVGVCAIVVAVCVNPIAINGCSKYDQQCADDWCCEGVAATDQGVIYKANEKRANCQPD